MATTTGECITCGHNRWVASLPSRGTVTPAPPPVPCPRDCPDRVTTWPDDEAPEGGSVDVWDVPGDGDAEPLNDGGPGWDNSGNKEGGES